MTSCRIRDSTVPALDMWVLNAGTWSKRPTKSYLPFKLLVWASCRSYHLQVIAVFVEEVVLLEELGPISLPNDDLVHDIGALQDQSDRE